MGQVPKLRFEGFEGDWKRKKFGDIGSVSMCKRVFKNETTNEGDVPFFKIGTFGGQPDAFISRELYEEYKNKYSFPKVGDILLSASGTIGRLVEYRGEDAYYQDSNIIWLSHDESTSNRFLKSLYEIVEWNGIEGSTIKRLYNDNFLKTSFYIPLLQEQEKIGGMLSNLDHLITLHQRKHDALLKAKQFYLQNLFPRKGEKTPCLRFAGFSGEWEEKKLGEVFKEYSVKNYPELPPLTIVQGRGTVLRDKSDRNLQYEKSSLSAYKVVRKDDFIVHLRSFEGGLEIARSDGIVSPAYHVLHGEGTDSRFYYPYFRSSRFILGQLTAFVYGIRDGRSIDIDGMKTIVIPVPSYEEQKAIGDFLTNLDHLITTQQRKLETLKRLKQFMLQNLFV